MIDPDWMDGLSEETKRKIVKSELERVLKEMAKEIGEIKRRITALEGKHEKRDI